MDEAVIVSARAIWEGDVERSFGDGDLERVRMRIVVRAHMRGDPAWLLFESSNLDGLGRVGWVVEQDPGLLVEAASKLYALLTAQPLSERRRASRFGRKKARRNGRRR